MLHGYCNRFKIPEITCKLQLSRYESDLSVRSLPCNDLKIGQPRPLLFYLSAFSNTIIDLRGIRTQIVGVEGEHDDHQHKGPLPIL